MSYYLFEIPSVNGDHADLVLADPDNPNAPAYYHYAFTIGAPANPNELTQRRDLSQPINPQGASAKEVYHMISLLEEDALKPGSKSLETYVLEAAKSASQELAKWLEQTRKLGGLTKKSYFLPIPVVLVAVLP